MSYSFSTVDITSPIIPSADSKVARAVNVCELAADTHSALLRSQRWEHGLCIPTSPCLCLSTYGSLGSEIRFCVHECPPQRLWQCTSLSLALYHNARSWTASEKYMNRLPLARYDTTPTRWVSFRNLRSLYSNRETRRMSFRFNYS